jgi:hypothetical protein
MHTILEQGYNEKVFSFTTVGMLISATSKSSLNLIRTGVENGDQIFLMNHMHAVPNIAYIIVCTGL